MEPVAGQPVRADGKGGNNESLRPFGFNMRRNLIQPGKIRKGFKQEMIRAQRKKTINRPQQVVRVSRAKVSKDRCIKGGRCFTGKRVTGFQRLGEGFALHVKRRKGVGFDCHCPCGQIGSVDSPDT